MFFYSESMASAISSGHTDANISDFVDQHWALPVARFHQSTHHLLYNMRVLFGCMLEVDLPILCSYHRFAFQQHSFPKQLPQNCLLLTNDYTSRYIDCIVHYWIILYSFCWVAGMILDRIWKVKNYHVCYVGSKRFLTSLLCVYCKIRGYLQKPDLSSHKTAVRKETCIHPIRLTFDT